MSLFSVVQLVCANFIVSLCILILATSAGANDIFVYAVFPPWLATPDVQRRIAVAGGRNLQAGTWPLGAKIALSDRDGRLRLIDAGAWIVLSASPALCSHQKVSAL